MKLSLLLFLSIWLGIICTTLGDQLQIQSVAVSKHSGTAAGGNNKNGKKYTIHKALKSSGKKSTHDEENAKKGEVLKELHKKDDEEGGGKKTDYHSEGKHKSYKKSGGKSEDGAKFKDAAHHKKANFKKGFREKYHKDEEKKHDSFYSTSHKDGQYKIFGQKHSKHASHVLAKKIKNNHKSAKSEDVHGNSGKKVGGHNVNEKSGHQQAKSTSSHHDHKNKWANKVSKKGGKQYKYKIPRQ